jgi:glucose-1-phosphate cytidylyltransferase
LNDFTVSLADGKIKPRPTQALDWNVSVVDTGATTMTGGRLLRLRNWLKNETFMTTYSDMGISDRYGKAVLYIRANASTSN